MYIKYHIRPNTLTSDVSDILKFTDIYWDDISTQNKYHLFDRQKYIHFQLDKNKSTLCASCKFIDDLPTYQYDNILPRIQRMNDDTILGRLDNKNCTKFFMIIP